MRSADNTKVVPLGSTRRQRKNRIQAVESLNCRLLIHAKNKDLVGVERLFEKVKLRAIRVFR